MDTDKQQMLIQMLMGGGQPQQAGGMAPAMSSGQSVGTGAMDAGSQFLKMMMMKNMMGQQPQTASPNNQAFGQAFQQQNPMSLGVQGPPGVLSAPPILTPQG